jgi:hypothetical protein
MIQLQFKASWDAAAGRMTVTLSYEDQLFIERFTKREWRKYVHALRKHETSLRVGGLTLNVIAKAGKTWLVLTAVRQYLLAVADTFEKTGQTEMLTMNEQPLF